MNPLQFPKGVRLSEHINALLEVFQGSFTLEGPTYKFLSSSIQKSYTDLGWDIEDINDNNCSFQYGYGDDISLRSPTYNGLITGYTSKIDNGNLRYKTKVKWLI